MDIKKNKEPIQWRIIRILILVIVGLSIMLGAYYAYSKNKISLSPQQCEDKIWCLDYNTVATQGSSCLIITSDCSQNERCLDGECVLR